MARLRRTSRGFTLVELLVVISIIGMLMALLLPAVQAARETGRRNTCQSQQHNISLALLQFAEAKRYYPGWDNNINVTSPAGTTLTVSYIVMLFPYMERNDVYQSLLAGNYNTNTLVYMPLLICPSNPPTSQGNAPIAYVINGGQFTGTAASPANVPSSNTSAQTALASTSGIAYDLSQTSIAAGTGVKVGQDYIVSHDGSTYTLLLSENDNIAQQVYLPQTAVKGNTTTPTNAANLGTQQYGLVFQWTGSIAATAGAAPVQTTAPSGFYTINGSKGTNETLTQVYARPASNHPGGVVAAFCDGHVRFIGEDIAYNVYKQLMSPYGVGTGDTDQGATFPLNDTAY